jgi:hypothetical protein
MRAATVFNNLIEAGLVTSHFNRIKLGDNNIHLEGVSTVAATKNILAVAESVDRTIIFVTGKGMFTLNSVRVYVTLTKPVTKTYEWVYHTPAFHGGSMSGTVRAVSEVDADMKSWAALGAILNRIAGTAAVEGIDIYFDYRNEKAGRLEVVESC